MGSKYNSGTQYEPLDHIETGHYHIAILFILYHRCASMLCFGDFNHTHQSRNFFITGFCCTGTV